MTTQETAAAQVMDAVKAGDADALRAVLARDPSAAAAPAGNGDSPLLMALYTGRRDLADLLVAHGRLPDAFEAAALGDVDRLRTLLDAEPAAVRRFSSDGWTMLHLAGFFGHVDAMRLLLERGADVRAVSTNAMRNTPLHATLAGPSGIAGARLLADAGADVNARQHGGYTALHAAAQHGAIDLVDLLLERGADPDAAADDGRRPVDFARGRGHEHAAARLAARGTSA